MYTATSRDQHTSRHTASRRRTPGPHPLTHRPTPQDTLQRTRGPRPFFERMRSSESTEDLVRSRISTRPGSEKCTGRCLSDNRMSTAAQARRLPHEQSEIGQHGPARTRIGRGEDAGTGERARRGVAAGEARLHSCLCRGASSVAQRRATTIDRHRARLPRGGRAVVGGGARAPLDGTSAGVGRGPAPTPRGDRGCASACQGRANACGRIHLLRLVQLVQPCGGGVAATRSASAHLSSTSQPVNLTPQRLRCGRALAQDAEWSDGSNATSQPRRELPAPTSRELAGSGRSRRPPASKAHIAAGQRRWRRTRAPRALDPWALQGWREE